MINKLKKKDGAFSIIAVLVVFIACMVGIGFTDMLIRSYTMNELQSIMDTSGVSALQQGVDRVKLRIEEFDVDEHVVESVYKDLVTKRIDDSERILDYQFVRTKVDLMLEGDELNKWGKWGVGYSSKKHPQARLDSTMIIVVGNSHVFDMVPGLYRTFYDSRNDTNFAVTYMGKTEDGNVELAVRSVSRIVYR